MLIMLHSLLLCSCTDCSNLASCDKNSMTLVKGHNMILFWHQLICVIF